MTIYLTGDTDVENEVRKNWIFILTIKCSFLLKIQLDVYWLGKCYYLEIHTPSRHTRGDTMLTLNTKAHPQVFPVNRS